MFVFPEEVLETDAWGGASAEVLVSRREAFAFVFALGGVAELEAWDGGAAEDEGEACRVSAGEGLGEDSLLSSDSGSGSASSIGVFLIFPSSVWMGMLLLVRYSVHNLSPTSLNTLFLWQALLHLHPEHHP